MKRAILWIFVAALALVFVAGCQSGTGNADAAMKNSTALENYNDQALKNNPPPPGEGPGS